MVQSCNLPNIDLNIKTNAKQPGGLPKRFRCFPDQVYNRENGELNIDEPTPLPSWIMALEKRVVF